MQAEHTEPMLSRYLHAKGCQLGLPVAGNFELTARCNFDCRMCYVHLTGEEQKERGAELPADWWLQTAEKARDMGMVFLLLTGGEPLIRPDFKYLLTELKKLGLLVSLNTNASLIDAETLDFFRREPPLRVNVSLYGGCNETYEKLCGRPAFDRVLAAIRGLREIGVSVKLNASLTPYNRGDAAQIHAIARELDLQVQFASYMFPPARRDAKMTGKGDRFTPEEAAACAVECDLLRFTDEEFKLRAERLREGLAAPAEADCEGAPGEGIACRAGRSAFWINWQGVMTPCGMMTEPGVSAVEKGFEAAWEETKKQAAAVRLPPECAGCGYKNACHACAAMCLTETGRFGGRPDYVCRMTRESFALTQAEYRRRYGGEA